MKLPALPLVKDLQSQAHESVNVRLLGAAGGAAAAQGVALGDVAGDGVDAGPGVAFQRPHRGVPGALQQGGGVGAVLGFAGQGRVAELVQRPASPLQVTKASRAGQKPSPTPGCSAPPSRPAHLRREHHRNRHRILPLGPRPCPTRHRVRRKRHPGLGCGGRGSAWTPRLTGDSAAFTSRRPGKRALRSSRRRLVSTRHPDKAGFAEFAAWARECRLVGY